MKISHNPTSGIYDLEINESDKKFFQKVSKHNFFGILGDGVALWRYKNAIKVIEKAKKFTEEHDVPLNALNILPSKFLVKLMDEASLEEDENMQMLWAKLLVGESSEPGSYSLRTIETLKLMTADEARLFSKYLRLVFYAEGSGFIPHLEKICEKHSISYIEILELSNLRVIDLGVGFEIEEGGSFLISAGGNYVLDLKAKESNTNEGSVVKQFFPRVPSGLLVHRLTTSGFQISKLSQLEDNLAYLKDVEEVIRTEFPHLSVSLHSKKD